MALASILVGRPVSVKGQAYPSWAGRQGVIEKHLVMPAVPRAGGPYFVCSMLPYFDEPAEMLVFHVRELDLM